MAAWICECNFYFVKSVLKSQTKAVVDPPRSEKVAVMPSIPTALKPLDTDLSMAQLEVRAPKAMDADSAVGEPQESLELPRSNDSLETPKPPEQQEQLEQLDQPEQQ